LLIGSAAPKHPQVIVMTHSMPGAQMALVPDLIQAIVESEQHVEF
tara:strand:+ start:3519 stop:3653 length:135 start_codon:yes stop_codon:yes gene_type:complete